MQKNRKVISVFAELQRQFGDTENSLTLLKAANDLHDLLTTEETYEPAFTNHMGRTPFDLLEISDGMKDGGFRVMYRESEIMNAAFESEGGEICSNLEEAEAWLEKVA